MPLIAGLVLNGCTGDDSAPADTEAAATGTTAADDAPDDGNDVVDTTAAVDTTANPTSEGDPCDGVDCPPGEECLAGTCFPAAGSTGGECAEWGTGMWADCADGQACGGVGGGCLGTGVDGEGSCIFDCETVCDCPEAPASGTANVACEDIAGPGGPDGVPDCYLDCAGGSSCPDGMTCIGNSFCAHTNATDPVGPYEGCDPPAFPCPENSSCISDNVEAPTVSTCAEQGCTVASDCPDAPAGGTAACDVITGGDDPPMLCHLTCDGAACPEGWECFGGFICLQPVPVGPEVGFGNCNPLSQCLANEECYEVTIPGGTGTGTGGSGSGSGTGGSTGGEPDPAYNVCTVPDCADAMACPLAPGTGTADPACGDIGGGNDTCYLDCSGGATCPDSMVCVDDLYCAFDTNDTCTIAIGDPSFEAGTPNPSWDETSTNFGTPLCTVDTCGGGASHTGDWFIWFGGLQMPEDASMEQDVFIPSTATDLSLYLNFASLGAAMPAQDTMTVLIDGNEEFLVTGADQAMFVGYTQVLIDISTYADDASHTVRIESSTAGDGAGMTVTNIFVDDVTLVCG